LKAGFNLPNDYKVVYFLIPSSSLTTISLALPSLSRIVVLTGTISDLNNPYS